VFEIYQRYTPSQGVVQDKSMKMPNTNGMQQRRTAENMAARQHNNNGSNRMQPVQPMRQSDRPKMQQNGVKENQERVNKLSQISSQPQNTGQRRQESNPTPKYKERQKGRKVGSFFENIIPKGFYDPKTKKVLGFFTAEDLLLVALIFIFLDSEDEDNPLTALALLYVLLGDYLDFGDFLF